MLNTTKIIKRVAIFGDGAAKKTDQHFKDAFEVAKLLAEKGYIAVNGGGPGIMLAATLGAKKGGGRVEVVVIDKRVNIGRNYEDWCEKNIVRADKKYSTKSYEERLNKLIEMADAFVIFKGGTGTIAELGVVWSKAKFVYGEHEPIVLFGKFWREIIGTMEKNLNLERIEKRVIGMAERPEEVIKVLERVGAGN